MSVPQVSVILPTYNRAHTLLRAVRSVLAQSYPDIELIVVDDASTDKTQQVLAGVADPRLRVISCTENRGVSHARNLGVAAARGGLIALQDSDDEWRPDKLQRQLEALNDGVVLVLCGNLYVNAPWMSISRVAGGLGGLVDVTDQVPSRIPGAPCFLMRKSDFDAVGGFDEEISCFEDWELALRLCSRGRVMLVNEPLVMCQRTPGGLFSQERNYIPNLKRILQRHEALLRAHPPAWSRYCNLLGQSLCLFGECRAARPYFRRALATGSGWPRSLVNLTLSYLGSAVFRGYVMRARRIANWWRASRARYLVQARAA
jgi:glycosyltransferase involved in cell wall biosynthesis